MRKINANVVLLVLLFFFPWIGLEAFSQQPTGYDFKEIKRIKATPVKNQGKTGTCWSFATISFMESELLRKGMGSYDLSEMFVVRQSYIDRAELYIRFHGHLNFGPGAQAWDVLEVIGNDGLVPQKVYPGMKIAPDQHNHEEMDDVLKGYMKGLLSDENKTLTPVWKEGFKGILDAYLGGYPSAFTWQDQQFSPESFIKHLDLNPDNYVPFTSFSNHPYYSQYVFESPDNWSMERINNVHLDDLIRIIDQSIEKGYTVAWAADVSDPGFSHSSGLAIVPEEDPEDLSASNIKGFSEPVPQLEITVEMRQKAFNNFSTTDDHLMHITGIAKDQNGTKYYIVKNSWGTGNPYGGYLYASEAYVRLKTMSLTVNKKPVPSDIKNKLDL
jgi:bleomycin hydrolase